MAFIANPAQAGWFSSRNDSESCKAKFDDKCQKVDDARDECSDEYVNFYSLVNKLKSDLETLNDAQSTSEKIFKELQSAY